MKILAVDGNSLLNRSYYGVRDLKTSEGFPTNAVYGFLTTLERLDREIDPELLAVAWDRAEPTFRHQEYAGYKAKRHGMPDDLAQQLPVAKELVEKLGGRQLELPGYEADDLLGTVARLAEEQGIECVLATGDRDSLQLVRPGVQVRLSTNKEALWYDEQRVLQEYGVQPSELVEVKALMGDPSDQIPGVRGIGEKTALKLIAQYHSIDRIFESLDDPTLPARAQKLLRQPEAYAQAKLSHHLGKIVQEAPLAIALLDCKRRPVDREGLLALYRRLEFKRQIEALGEKASSVAPQADALAVRSGLPVEQARRFLSSCERLDFLWEDRLEIHAGDCILIYEEGSAEAFSQLIGKSDLPKRTQHLKELYARCMAAGIEEPAGVTLSVDLAVYLLDVLKKEASIQDWAERYHLPLTSEEEYREITVLPALCDRLEEELKEEGLTELLTGMELPLARVLARMEQVGIGVDRAGVEAFGSQLSEQIDRLTGEIYQLAGEKFNIQSTRELGDVLFQKLSLPTFKKTKSGYSTNVQTLERLVRYHPIAEKLLAYRRYTKLHSTYVLGLCKEIQADGRVHSHFRQTETRTGRISSIEPNLQNIPIRTSEGSQMRRFFVAREGYLLVDADYSQIELRVLAHISRDQRMIEAFDRGEDIHTATAAEVFGLDPMLVPSELRRRAKAINFGIVYGIGAYSLSQDLGVSVQEAKQYIQSYLNQFSGVKRYREEVVDASRASGETRTLYGRVRRLPEISSKNYTQRSFGERVALNTPIQGTAADIIKIAMVRVEKRLEEEGLDARLVLQIHDELLVEAAERDAAAAAELLQYEMEHAGSLTVPLVAEVSCAQDWYQAKGAAPGESTV